MIELIEPCVISLIARLCRHDTVLSGFIMYARPTYKILVDVTQFRNLILRDVARCREIDNFDMRLRF